LTASALQLLCNRLSTEGCDIQTTASLQQQQRLVELLGASPAGSR